MCLKKRTIFKKKILRKKTTIKMILQLPINNNAQESVKCCCDFNAVELVEIVRLLYNSNWFYDVVFQYFHCYY